MRTTLDVMAPDPKMHREAMFDLIAKCFGNYFSFHKCLTDGYIDDSHYDWPASRIGMMDGKIVTHYGVWDYPMRIGSARVRTGGIGAVATHRDYRKRGLMAQTAPHSVRAMRELGYDFSILFGISDFYDQFGYVRAWSEVDYDVRPADLPAERLGYRIRPFTMEPRADLTRLYNRQFARVTGTAVRPTYSRLHPYHRSEGFGWADDKGQVVGYLAVARNGARLDVVEAVGEDEQVLRAAHQLGRKFGAETVRFRGVPYGTTLAQRLRRGTCQVHIAHRRCGGAMIRTINLPRALGKMAGELSMRLKRSELADWKGDLFIADKDDVAVLRIGGGQVAAAEADGKSGGVHSLRGGDEVAQLLIGTADPLETVEGRGIRLRGDARRLLPVLFPCQHPTLHLLDHY